MNKRLTGLIIAFLLLVLSFSLRYFALSKTPPLWVDEFSTGAQALLIRQGIENGAQSIFPRLEHQNVTTHLLAYVSASLFGWTEAALRLPFVIIGSVFVGLFFVLLQRVSSLRVALVTSLLLATSYFEITWSLQARGYVLQQLLGAALLMAYFGLKNKLQAIVLAVIFVLGLLTHSTFVFWFVPLFVDFALESFSSKKFSFKHLLPYLAGAMSLFSIVFLLFGGWGVLIKFYQGEFLTLTNNLWFYHAFLWREYSLIIFLALFGACIGLIRFPRLTRIVLIFLSIHLTFFVFIFGHYKTKYLLAAFPYILLLAGMAVTEISDQVRELYKKHFAKIGLPDWIIPLGVALFIIGNGNHFVVFPQSYYSVNFAMREIAVVDYDAVYERIRQRSAESEEPSMIIDTWHDRIRWYKKEYFPQDIAVLSWVDAGFERRTDFEEDENGQKRIRINGKPETRLIVEESDLILAMSEYKTGFLYIDDSTLPADVQRFAQEKMFKELELKEFQPEVLENPYSVWPATLYSWGFETENPYYDASTSAQRE